MQGIHGFFACLRQDDVIVMLAFAFDNHQVMDGVECSASSRL